MLGRIYVDVEFAKVVKIHLGHVWYEGIEGGNLSFPGNELLVMFGMHFGPIFREINSLL